MQRKSVLLVEDDAAIRDVVQVLLEISGYDVTTASNGKDGLERLAKASVPGVILLDLMMPVMDGWQFLEARDHDLRLSNIPVVVLSAYDDRGCRDKANGFLKKPFDRESLLGVVRQFCG